MRGNDAGLVGCFEDHCAGTITEQHAGCAIGPVENSLIGFRTYYQYAAGAAGPYESVSHVQHVNES